MSNIIAFNPCRYCREPHRCKMCELQLYRDGVIKNSEWISVDERLPEEDGVYITFTNAKGKSEGVVAQSLVTKTIRGNTIRRWEWQTRISPWVVTHWMPLPKAPKMKGDSDDT